MKKIATLIALSLSFVSAQNLPAPVQAPVLPKLTDYKQGIRALTFMGLEQTKTLLNLNNEEFGSLLASYQQNEVAATTAQPSAEQLEVFARVQVLNDLCVSRFRDRAEQKAKQMPYLSLFLDSQERLNNFTGFTGKINLKQARDKIGNLDPLTACAQAAQLVKP